MSNQVKFYLVSEHDCGQRLDNFLFKYLKNTSKDLIYKVIRKGNVRVNLKRKPASYKLCVDDSIRIPPFEERYVKKILKPGHTVFDILYEDDCYIAINKPAGMACHGGSGVSFGVIERIRANYPNLAFLELVHRLDKDTSGVLVMAKKRSALTALHGLIRERLVSKRYIALTYGIWQNNMTVDMPLTKYIDGNCARLVRVDAVHGLQASTRFEISAKYKIDNNLYCTLVAANPVTGRTHQIRVHLQHAGHYILGDDKYGDRTLNKQLMLHGLNRMFLHAEEFIFAIDGREIAIKADLSPELVKFLDVLELCHI